MSLEKILTSAKEGNVESMVKYARAHFSGVGVEKDLDVAKKWFQKAADLDSAEAKTYLAYMSANGIALEKDTSYAVDLYREAALKEDPIACYSLGIIYENGMYNEVKDTEHAVLLYEKAAKANIIEAKYRIGMIKEAEYLKAIQTAQDMMAKMKANALSIQAEAALKEASDKGYMPAKYALGIKYLNSQDNVKKVNALKLFEAYAEVDPIAYYAIAFMYDTGSGVKKDYAKSFEYFNKAKDAGYKKAVLNIANAYICGAGVPRDFKKAIDICRNAVNSGIKEANYYAGVCFKNGFGIPKNIDKAEELFSYAANVNYPYAYYELGVLNDKAYGFGDDEDSAIEYYTKAAEFNIANAKAELAKRTYNKDKKKGFEALKEASEQGSFVASEFIAKMYETGDSVKIDSTKALEYYKKATDCGSLTAASKVVEIATKTNNAVVKKQYEDKAQLASEFDVCASYAKTCEEAKDFERAAYYYALATIKAVDEDEAHKMYDSLNRFTKSDVSGSWSVK